ncbi:hypothetical protein ACFXP3_01600 [Streptomyces sp. NPDC059096]|uniref:hypothetical protein n=1 Tax=Streptomyces sp. NPDC059096 TaxID=3346727 RepID=UPI0036CBC93C
MKKKLSVAVEERPRLFRITLAGQAVEVQGGRVTREAELQRRVESSMEVMLEVRLLASEHPTGDWIRGRIDSLGLDQDHCPVVVEYKRGMDAGILSQGASYLEWVHSAPHELKALTKEKLGSEVAESINYRKPRLICIAADFSHRDWVTARRLPWRIDLLRYRVFNDGSLILF